MRNFFLIHSTFLIALEQDLLSVIVKVLDALSLFNLYCVLLVNLICMCCLNLGAYEDIIYLESFNVRGLT